MTWNEKHRPVFHYTVDHGFMNDPNGMVYDSKDGIFHLFYQYHFEDLNKDKNHGTLTVKEWGHATSKDLIHWEEKPVAFYGDERHLIWSGAGVIDMENSSGLFSPDLAPEKRFIFVYANCGVHYIPLPDSNSIVNIGMGYSPDGGETFVKLPPAIANENNKYSGPIGDPKLLYYEEEKLWVLFTAHLVQIFTSKNLRDWNYEGKALYHGEPFGFECPDVFPIMIDGEKKWVYSSAGKYYIVGSLGRNSDGIFTFTPESDKIERDTGNQYATQHFYGFGDRIVQMSWMPDNSSLDFWRDGKLWDGAQTIPTEFSIKKKGDGYKLYNYPVKELDALRGEVLFDAHDIEVTDRSPNILENVKAEIFDLECEFNLSEIEQFEFDFRKDGREETYLLFTRDHCYLHSYELALCTYNSGKVRHDYYRIPLDTEEKKLRLRLLCDKSIFDLFVNDGESYRSQYIFSEPESDGMLLTVKGKLKINDIKIYKINP